MLAFVAIALALRPVAQGGGLSRAGEIAPPAGAVSWWRFDPTSFASTKDPAPERRFFLATIRAAIASGLFGDGTSAKVIEGILAASEVGAVKHTLSLYDFEADRPPSGTGVDIQRLRMVLELHTDQNHAHYLRTIKAIAVDAERSKGAVGASSKGVQRLIELPDGTKAVSFRFPDWPAWRELSWCSRNDSFVIAIGRGALSARFDGEAVGREASWDAHLRTVDASRRAGNVFFGAFLDIDHLRRSFPAAFAEGRTTRMVEALHLNGASELMLHGRLVEREDERPPMLAIDATTRDRASDGIRHAPVSLGAWSDDLPDEPTGGSYVLAAPVVWEPFAWSLIDIFSATIRDDEVGEFRLALDVWRDAKVEAFQRVLRALEPWVIVSDEPTPVVPAPGLSTYIIAIKPDADVDRLRADMAGLLAKWSDVVSRSNSGVWTLSLHESGLVRFPTWAVVASGGDAALVAGWGPGVIEHTRRAMRERDTPQGATARDTSRSSGPSPRR